MLAPISPISPDLQESRMLAQLTKPESDVEKVRRKCWGLLLRALFPLTLCARRVRALVLFLFPCCTPRAERAAHRERLRRKPSALPSRARELKAKRTAIEQEAVLANLRLARVDYVLRRGHADWPSPAPLSADGAFHPLHLCLRTALHLCHG